MPRGRHGARSCAGRECAQLYRFRTEVLGELKLFPLVPGPNRVGSLESNEVALPVAGVLPHHAVLEVTPEALQLRDVGGRGDTWVNGRRATRAVLASGDVLRCGPVELALEKLDPRDLRVGIALADRPPREAPAPAPAAALGPERLAEGEWAGQWLLLLDEVLARLRGGDAEAEFHALEGLGRHLKVRGLCLGELWREAPREPWFLASYGEIGNVFVDDEVGQFYGRALGAEAGESTFALLNLAFGAPLALASLSLERGHLLGLAVHGDFPGRAASAPLLRGALAAVALLRRGREPAPTRPEEPAGVPRRGDLRFPSGHVQGRSAAVQALYRDIHSLAASGLPVLIVGETGSGKEHVARMLHDSSPRAGGPFVVVNCAAIPADLLEAEMFGVGKNVATGVSERPGKFLLASGGTLALDEVGEMQGSLQAKLLRVLEDKQVQPLGRPAQAVDVRVVAMTNRNLPELMAEGRFRPDLYYRIAGTVLEVPPLRRRREDIPLLVEHFLRRFSSAAGKDVGGLSLWALELLSSYDWPGNLRELQHEMQRLIYTCAPGALIQSSHLSPHIRAQAGRRGERAATVPEPLDLKGRVEELERSLLTEALARTDGNQSAAAKLLGISRNGLALKIRRFGLETS